jgi:hypothetical protein
MDTCFTGGSSSRSSEDSTSGDGRRRFEAGCPPPGCPIGDDLSRRLAAGLAAGVLPGEPRLFCSAWLEPLFLPLPSVEVRPRT